MWVHSPLVGVYGPSLFCMHSVPLNPLLALLFLRWKVHLVSVQAHFTTLFKWSTDSFQSACSVPDPMVHKLLGKQHRQTNNKKVRLPKRLRLAEATAV